MFRGGKRTTVPSRVSSRRAFLASILLVSSVSALSGQTPKPPDVPAFTIDRAKGVDIRVDYTTLDRYGAWDDRNYQLTLEDLAYLPEDEDRWRDVIPAFFRIMLRKA
ncbi:MAG: hypothetical protein OES47_11455, partial [Acidobacteriota bacterium]|nr:hypothetical protein [Acidobacteriota bacterium]